MHRNRDGSPSLQLTKIEQRATVAYETSAGLGIAERPGIGSSGWLLRLRTEHWAEAAAYDRKRAARLRANAANDLHPMIGNSHDARGAESDASARQFRADVLATVRDNHRSEITSRPNGVLNAEHPVTRPRHMNGLAPSEASFFKMAMLSPANSHDVDTSAS